MESLNRKHKNLMQAIATIKETLNAIGKLDNYPEQLNVPAVFDRESLYKFLRDSLVQRFEYSTDLFWKYLKIYLEKVAMLTTVNSPATAIRESCSYGLLSEVEGQQALNMIRSRNLTSHVYLEEVAAKLAKEIPEYYKFMKTVSQRLAPKVDKE